MRREIAGGVFYFKIRIHSIVRANFNSTELIIDLNREV